VDTAQIIIVVYLLSIAVTYIYIFRNNRLVFSRKCAWAMVVFWLGPVGSILYYFFGYNPKEVKPKKTKQDLDKIEIGHKPHYPYDLK
jgi:hypothetical protein